MFFLSFKTSADDQKHPHRFKYQLENKKNIYS